MCTSLFPYARKSASVANWSGGIFFNLSEFGEVRFREMELAFFKEKSKQTGHIFSTGGGIVLQTENRNILKNKGTTFFLNASTKVLANRIHNTEKRPLLSGSKNFTSLLEKIWIERKEYYEDTSHYTIDTDILSPSQVLGEILNILGVPLENH